MNDKISKFFGISEEESTAVTTIDDINSDMIIVPNDVEKEISDEDVDYALARENITKLTKQGMESLEDLIELAPKLQNYKAYESIGMLIKDLVNANKDLAELSRKKTQLAKYDETTAPSLNDHAPTVNNNLFVGTTAELFEMLKNKKEV